MVRIHKTIERRHRYELARRRPQRKGQAVEEFSPTDIDGCVLWLRSDTCVKDESDRVSEGTDKSGNSHHVLQTTDAKKPVYHSNQINGHPCWRFDGVDDWLKASAFTWNRPEVVYIVFKPISWTREDRIFDGNALNVMSFFQEIETPKYFIYAGQENWQQYPIQISNGTWVIVRTRFTADAGCGLRKNNESEAANPANAATDAQGFRLGAAGENLSCSNIDVAEVIGYNAVPSAEDDAAIMNYLNTRYALY